MHKYVYMYNQYNVWDLIYIYLYICVYLSAQSLSRVRLFATPWTVAHQAPPLSMGFSRQEYWSGLSFPSPGDLPHQGSNSSLLRLPPWQQAFFYHWRQLGSPICPIWCREMLKVGGEGNGILSFCQTDDGLSNERLMWGGNVRPPDSCIFCLGNSTDRGAWRGYSPWGCKESDRPDPSVHSSCGHDCAHPPTVVNTENTHIHKSIYILLIQKR